MKKVQKTKEQAKLEIIGVIKIFVGFLFSIFWIGSFVAILEQEEANTLNDIGQMVRMTALIAVSTLVLIALIFFEGLKKLLKK